MRTDYPYAGEVIFEVTHLEKPRSFAVAFRKPGWCNNAVLPGSVLQNGYLVVRRKWQAGDQLKLSLDMPLRAEPIRDDANLLALLRGSMVMAADLGPADEPFRGDAPVLVGTSTEEALKATTLSLRPFYAQYDRRSAVYFPRLSEQQWQIEQAARAAEKARIADLDARSIDIVALGEKESEDVHQLKQGTSQTVLYRGRTGRWARSKTPFEFRVRSSNEPLTLQATYWGKQRGSRFKIFADGVQIGSETMDGDGPIAFVERSYALPTNARAKAIKGEPFVVIRFEPEPGGGAGPVFGCRILKA
jgi:hypothetical protein